LLLDPQCLLTVVEKQNIEMVQMSLKLAANSMFGCLGATSFRFYSKEFAATIAFIGRCCLKRALNVSVQNSTINIMGDTDSLLVTAKEYDNVQSTSGVTPSKLTTLIQVSGNTIMHEVNKQFTHIRLAESEVYRKVYILKKKQYAALCLKRSLSVTHSASSWIPYLKKSLQFDTRTYCKLVGIICNDVLEEIMYQVNEDIMLKNVVSIIRSIPVVIETAGYENFVITTQLGKELHEYQTLQEHVQVALQLRAIGMPASGGQFIDYLICKMQDQNLNQAERAFHPSVFLQTKGRLRLDLRYYVEVQIAAPLKRLCKQLSQRSVTAINKEIDQVIKMY
jgi:DNA polymerase alpha subunit A